jgi:hypothetical protein
MRRVQEDTGNVLVFVFLKDPINDFLTSLGCNMCQGTEDHHCRGLGFMLTSSSLNVKDVTPAVEVKDAKSGFQNHVCRSDSSIALWSSPPPLAMLRTERLDLQVRGAT